MVELKARPAIARVRRYSARVVDSPSGRSDPAYQKSGEGPCLARLHAATSQATSHDFEYFAGAWSTQAAPVSKRAASAAPSRMNSPAVLCMNPRYPRAAPRRSMSSTSPTQANAPGSRCACSIPPSRQWSIYWVKQRHRQARPGSRSSADSPATRGEFYARRSGERRAPDPRSLSSGARSTGTTRAGSRRFRTTIARGRRTGPPISRVAMQPRSAETVSRNAERTPAASIAENGESGIAGAR